jgi:hypothetical protein
MPARRFPPDRTSPAQTLSRGSVALSNSSKRIAVAFLHPLGSPLGFPANAIIPATDGRSSAAKFSGKRIHHRVPNAGHALPQQAPKVFADAVMEVMKAGGSRPTRFTPPLANAIGTPQTETSCIGQRRQCPALFPTLMQQTDQFLSCGRFELRLAQCFLSHRIRLSEELVYVS